MVKLWSKATKADCTVVKPFSFIFYILFFLGVLLLSINSLGLFFLPKKLPVARETLSYAEAKQLLQKAIRKRSSNLLKATAVTNVFYRSIHNYWVGKYYYDGKYHFTPITSLYKNQLRISILNNWLLYALSYLSPRASDRYFYSQYEYPEYSWAIARGVGLCSQHALALADYMNKNGYSSKAINLAGHVVDETRLSRAVTIVQDSDYGVTMPFSLLFAQHHLEVVKSYYMNNAQEKITSRHMLEILSWYGYDPAIPYGPLFHRHLIKYRVLKWGLPVFLIVISVLYLCKKRKLMGKSKKYS